MQTGQGQGVANDYVEGLKWLIIAAASGSENASRDKSAIEKVMLPNLAGEAALRANEWMLKARENAK